MPRKGPRSRQNDSADIRKIRILGYLYSHAEGANQNTINSLPGLNSQRWDIVKDILNELVDADSIIMETHDEIKKGATLYKITDKGKQTVDKLKDFHNAGLGEGFDLFRGLEFD